MSVMLSDFKFLGAKKMHVKSSMHVHTFWQLLSFFFFLCLMIFFKFLKNYFNYFNFLGLMTTKLMLEKVYLSCECELMLHVNINVYNIHPLIKTTTKGVLGPLATPSYVWKTWVVWACTSWTYLSYWKMVGDST
jgi:hypothetical protein